MRLREILLVFFVYMFTLNVAFAEIQKFSIDDDDDNDDEAVSSTEKGKPKREKTKDEKFDEKLKELDEKIKRAEKATNILGQKKNGPQHPKLIAFNENAHKRPTKCQVCRVLMTELVAELNKTDNKKETVYMSNRLDEDGNDVAGKKIDYAKSEMRIVDTLETICRTTQNYKAIAGPDFPYLKGVKSMFRSELEGAMKKSGLALKLDAPEEVLDDPTFEVKRLFVYCNTMIEEHEETIVDWFLNRREEDPLISVCKNNILRGTDTDCLTASTEVPDYATQPIPDKEPSRIKAEL